MTFFPADYSVCHYFFSSEEVPVFSLLPHPQALPERGFVRHRGTKPSPVSDNGEGYEGNVDVKKKNYNTYIYIVHQTIIKIIFDII